MFRFRALLLTLLAASVAWFVVAAVPHFSTAQGSIRVEREHETVSAAVAAVRIVESVREVSRAPLKVETALVAVPPAHVERLPVAAPLACAFPRHEHELSVVLLI